MKTRLLANRHTAFVSPTHSRASTRNDYEIKESMHESKQTERGDIKRTSSVSDSKRASLTARIAVTTALTRRELRALVAAGGGSVWLEDAELSATVADSVDQHVNVSCQPCFTGELAPFSRSISCALQRLSIWSSYAAQDDLFRQWSS